MHPIQWTIANPGGADQTTEKVTLYIIYWLAGPTVHSPGGASYLLSRHVTSWHLFHLARELC